MARSLAFGNGSSLICTDQYGRIRDLYFPYVGLENHIGGSNAHRVGVWVDGRLSWMDDGTWSIDVRSDTAYTGLTTAFSSALGIEILFMDILYNEKNIFIRRIKLYNKSNRVREIKLYFNQQYDIYGSEKGDTAFYDPATNTIIHYEGQRAFLSNAWTKEHGFDDYTVGIFQIEGKEGTYKDAEDGRLEKNPIEHGRVDSTIGTTLLIGPMSVAIVHYWLTMSTSIEGAKELNQYVLTRTPDAVIKSARDYWNAWVERNVWNFYGLGENVIDLFKKSQFFLRSHIDVHGGVLASGDSGMLQGGRDTYAYVWPRDGAYVSVALDWIGDRHSARKFFEFCNNAISSEGYMMHKYRADGSLGSSWHGYVVEGKPILPIQEDETALILWALWEHWLITKDLDFIETIYNSLIKKVAMFLSSHRDPYTGLPKPSFNLWEEKFGVHTYTAACTYAGLKAAAQFAEILGKERSEHNYRHVAEEMREAIMKHLYDEERGYFYRSVSFNGNKEKNIDATIDSSSAYGIFLFGVLDASDERLVKAMEYTKEKLSVRTPVGGICRYADDKYFRTGRDVVGNPWFITTLWYTQYAIVRAQNDYDLDQVRADLNWVERNALRSGILSEQIDPHTREQVSAAPLTWSHAEYLRTIVMYLRRLNELGIISSSTPF